LKPDKSKKSYFPFLFLTLIILFSDRNVKQTEKEKYNSYLDTIEKHPMCIKLYLLWRPYVLYFIKPLFTMDILDKLSRANSLWLRGMALDGVEEGHGGIQLGNADNYVDSWRRL